MANDFFSTLRVYLARISEGDRAPAEILASLNTWLRDSGESIKGKIEEEVERSVKKMGLAKQADFELLKKEVEALKKASAPGATSKPKKVAQKSATKAAPSRSSADSTGTKKASTAKKKAPVKGKK